MGYRIFQTSSPNTKNLYDYDSLVVDTYINSSGAESTSTGFACTPYISVESNTTYNFSIGGYVNSGGAGMAWYDSSKTLISFITGTNYGTKTSDVPFVFTKAAPENAAYLRLSINKADYTSKYASTIIAVKNVYKFSLIEKPNFEPGDLDGPTFSCVETED